MEKGKTVVLPIVHEGIVVPCRYRAGDALMRSAYGALEPDIRHATDPFEIELAFVPGVAFDQCGHRLGRGMGHYDRFLSQLCCVKVGVCFEAQIESFVPNEPHDVIMDAVCTDYRLIVCSKTVTPHGGNMP